VIIEANMDSKGKSNVINLRADVVVIGGGGGGLAAAAIAAEAGVKNVTLLEKASKPGGNARLSGGFFAVESPAQKRKGITTTCDETFKEHMGFTKWKDDPRIVRAWMRKSKDVVKWFEENGVGFSVMHFMAGGMRVYHIGVPGLDDKGFGGAVPQKGKQVIGMTGPLLEALTDSCIRHGVNILFGTPAKKIITDSKGTVTGVLAENKKEGKEIQIATKSAIIATGGFARNKKLLKMFFPEYGDVADIYSHSLGFMTGDGYLMAKEAGAATDDLVTVNNFSPHHYPWNPHITWLVRRPYLPWVNKKGERFIDESVWMYAGGIGWAMGRQPDNVSFTLLDSKIRRDMIRKLDAFEDAGPPWIDELESDLRSESDKGRVGIADSWDEIAKYIGAKPEALKATIEQYNSFCDNGYDDEFAKNKKYLLPLRTPPFYAALGRQGFDVAIGGIKINHHMEVLNNNDNPIKGLYAIGNDAGGAQGDTYNFGLPGSSFGFALSSGFIAAENAVEYLKASIK
jgi:fumarate reductase flavoprotein subunit